VAAMTAAVVTTVVLRLGVRFTGSDGIVFAKSISLTVLVTSAVWLVVTFLTAPEPDSKLLEFYRRVRPAAAGWKHVAELAPDIVPTHDGWYNLMDWLLGCLMVYMALFGIGKLVLGSTGVCHAVLACMTAIGSTTFWKSRD